MEMDYDIADSIRNMIIPEAVFWFTGENAPDDDEDYEYDSDEDDDYDEEESDEEIMTGGGASRGGLITTGANPRKGRGKKGGKDKGGMEGEKQECKQS